MQRLHDLIMSLEKPSMTFSINFIHQPHNSIFKNLGAYENPFSGWQLLWLQGCQIESKSPSQPEKIAMSWEVYN